MKEKLSAAKAEIEAQKEKTKKLKEKAEIEKEKKDEEISAAVEAAKSEARKQAFMESGMSQLKEENESLKRKLANSSDDSKIRFKILADELQGTFAECLKMANSDDTGNMRKALGIVIDNMKGQI